MKIGKIRLLRDVLLTLSILFFSTVIGGFFNSFGFHETNIVVVYIFSVLLVARFTKGYLFGIFASVTSLLLFNWFFTEPYFTFKVNDMTYLITFFIMTLTSVLTSALTTKAKQAAEQAKERENESNTLYRMTNHLTDAEGSQAIAKIVASAVGEVLNCPTAFICFDENSVPEKAYIQRKEDGSFIRRELKDAEELKRRMSQLHGEVDITEQDCLYPIYGKSDVLAVFRVPYSVGSQINESQTRMLHSIIESSALALERMRSFKAQEKSREETARERYRANLLRAISHDIRTPLSGIMGSAQMLMGATENDSYCYSLAGDIYNDALWLHDMVENILNLTKLKDGNLTLEKQPEAVEEVIGATLKTMEKRLPHRNIDVFMPDNVIMAPMDARLISQVLINLLDNADKHTPKNKEISISVSADGEKAKITVADRGSGIAENDLPHIFKMFYTNSGKIPDAKRGVGLGLSICQSIVEAHGGEIYARNRKNGGAAFTFTLPIGSDNL